MVLEVALIESISDSNPPPTLHSRRYLLGGIVTSYSYPWQVRRDVWIVAGYRR